MSTSCYRDPFVTDVYLWSMHLTKIISIPVNLFGFFCVIFKSSPHMQRYKWCLLHHLIWATVLDLNMSTLLIPDFLFPIAAADVLGVLRFVGMPPRIQAVIGISSSGSLIATLLHLFVYRHQVILPEYHKRHMPLCIRRLFLVVIYTYFSGISIPVYFLISPDQETSKNAIAATMSCVPLELFHETTMVVDANHFALLYVYMILFVFLGGGIGILLMVDSYLYLNSSFSHLSTHVKELHHSALRILLIQVAIPFCILAMPILFLLLGNFVGYTNQLSTSIVMQILALNGSISTIVMILLNPSYRKFAFNKCISSQKTVQVSPATNINTRVREELKRF